MWSRRVEPAPERSERSKRVTGNRKLNDCIGEPECSEEPRLRSGPSGESAQSLAWGLPSCWPSPQRLTPSPTFDTSSGLARALVWRDADVMDYRRLPSRSMDASAAPLELEEAPVGTESLSSVVPGDDLATFLKQSETAAFIVIRNDDIAYEGYSTATTGTQP